MNAISTLMLAVAIIASSASYSLADDAHHPAAASPAAGTAQALGSGSPASPPVASDAGSAAMSEGEIKNINKETGKITIKHGPLGNQAIPPMTTVFVVKDTAMLNLVRAGDKIGFVADKIDGKLTVMYIEVRN